MANAAHEDRKRLLIESLQASAEGVSLGKRTSSSAPAGAST